MAAIAKFVSFDGGIAFSDSVLKIQKRDEERGRLIPLDNITGIEVDEPLLGDDGCIRIQIAGRRPSIKNTIYFDEEKYDDALSFKTAFDSFKGQSSPALPPLEMFQPTSIAKRPQREQAGYTGQERPRRPGRQSKHRFKWWYAAIAVVFVALLATPGKEDNKEEPQQENAVYATMEPTASPEPTAEPTSEATAVVGFTSPPAATSPPVQEQAQTIVYVTSTGSKYHRAGCRHLSDSKIEITLEEAKRNYEPCGTCHPPT